MRGFSGPTFALRAGSLIIAAAALSLVLRSDLEMAHRPVVEDGYYVFTVARNIATGHGITVDGAHLTNGFQPLFTFLSVPCFIGAGANPYTAIRLVLFLHWLIFCATAYLIGAIARDSLFAKEEEGRAVVFWWVVFLYLSSVLIFIVNFNGLETGLLLGMYALAWRYYQSRGIETTRNLLGFGALLGVLIMTRVDALFFLVAIALGILLRPGQDKSVRRLVRTGMLCVSAFLVSSPWWLFNKIYFGSFMPTSGKAYRSWITPEDLSRPEIQERLRDGAEAFLRPLYPVVYLGQNTFEGLTIAFVRIVLIAGTCAFLWKKRHQIAGPEFLGEHAHPQSRRTLEFGRWLFVAMFFVAIIYTLSFSASWFYTRYFMPAAVVAIPLIGIAAYAAGSGRMWLSRLVPLALLVPILWVVVSLHKSTFQSEFITEQIQLVTEKVPPEDAVAAFQSGTLGYFRERVLNLDGKVNPMAVDRRPDLLEYVQSQGVRWLCDYPKPIEEILGTENLEKNGWKIVGKNNRFTLYHRE